MFIGPMVDDFHPRSNFTTDFRTAESSVISRRPASPPPLSTECHSEAQPKNLLFRKPLEKQMLRGVYPESHRRTQHDIQVISCIATQSLCPEEDSGLGLNSGSVTIYWANSGSIRERLAGAPYLNFIPSTLVRRQEVPVYIRRFCLEKRTLCQ